jgi:hypothetical protein
VTSGENRETGNIAPLTPALVSSMRRQGQFGESCFEFDCDRPPHRWLFALKPAARSKQLLDFEAPQRVLLYTMTFISSIEAQIETCQHTVIDAEGV